MSNVAWCARPHGLVWRLECIVHVSMPILMYMHAQHSFFGSASCAHACARAYAFVQAHSLHMCIPEHVFVSACFYVCTYSNSSICMRQLMSLFKNRITMCILLDFLFLCLRLFAILHVHDILVYACMYGAMCMHAHSHTIIHIHIHTFIHAYINTYTCSYIQNHIPSSFQTP